MTKLTIHLLAVFVGLALLVWASVAVPFAANANTNTAPVGIVHDDNGIARMVDLDYGIVCYVDRYGSSRTPVCFRITVEEKK